MAQQKCSLNQITKDLQKGLEGDRSKMIFIFFIPIWFSQTLSESNR